MPREIFREVAGGGTRHARRQWYTVPLSIVTHGALIVMFLAIPLLVSDSLPTPASVLVSAAPPPPPTVSVPSPDVQPRPVMAGPVSNPDIAPTAAPEGFTVEPPPTLSTLVQGIKIANRQYAGGWWDWLTPFTLLAGVALVIGYGLLGATWLNLKTAGPVQGRARRLALYAAGGTLVAIAAVSLWTPFLNPIYFTRWFQWPTARRK